MKSVCNVCIAFICLPAVLSVYTIKTKAESSFDEFRRQEQKSWAKFIDQQSGDNSAESKDARDRGAEEPVNSDSSVDLENLSNPATAAVLPTLPTITSWLPPAAVTNNAKHAIPQDPCIDLPLLPESEKELPELQDDLLATPLAKNITILTKNRYRATVTAAHEAMRQILGEMPPQKTAVFNRRWLELYDFPSAAAVNYLDRLNPLLVEFAALIQASETVLLEMGNLRFEAEMAAAYENEDAARSAMGQIAVTAEALKIIKRRLDGVAKAVELLGDPPDTRKEKCRTRRRFMENLAPPDSTNGAWVLTSVSSETVWKENDSRITTNRIIFADSKAAVFSLVPVKHLTQEKGWPDFIISWLFKWTAAPKLLRPDCPPAFTCLIQDTGVTYGDERVGTKIWLRSTNHVADTVFFNGMLTSWGEQKNVKGIYSTLLAELPPAASPAFIIQTASTCISHQGLR